MSDGTKIAVVTGAGRGIGNEICQQLVDRGCLVLATSKSFDRGDDFESSDGRIFRYYLDVTDTAGVNNLYKLIYRRFGVVDIIINNAGVYLDKRGARSGILEDPKLLFETINVNLFGAVNVVSGLFSLLARSSLGTIVNVSSGMGRVVELDGDSLYYRVSKSALNSLSRCLADRFSEYGILVYAACPGWVRTDMGGQRAVRSVECGARGIVDVALAPDPRKSGALLRDTEDFGW